MTTAVVRDQLEIELFADLFDQDPEGPPPPPPPPPLQTDSLAHVWIVAAEIKVEDRVAKQADFRGSFTASGGTRVDALEVYCVPAAAPTRTSPAGTAKPSSTTVTSSEGTRPYATREIPRPAPARQAAMRGTSSTH